MLKTTVAAGMIAGGLMALPPAASAAVVAPSALAAMADQQGNVIEVGRRGRGGWRGRGFRGHKFHRGRSFSRRSFGRRHYGYKHRGFRGYKHRGFKRHGRRHRGWRFSYGALPFVYGGYYSYRSSCGWLWRRYRYTGSRYWYRRWRACRYYW